MTGQNAKGLTAALIVAAGRGSRAKRDDLDAPKQYVPLNGAPVLGHCLRPFLLSPKIDFILTAIHEDDLETYQDVITNLSCAAGARLLPPVFGGATRQQTVHAGLQRLSDFSPQKVLIHDGARPFLTESLLRDVIDELDHCPAVLPCVAVADTLKRGTDGQVVATVDRAGLWRAQTPQGFHFSVIEEAHQRAVDEERQDFTDDASLLEWTGTDVRIVQGFEDNIKITTAEDFTRGERILQGQVNIRMGNGFDVHEFEPGDEVILCGVRVPYSQKLKGHSDADVGLHALTDAIYGALGAGDIGQHFPPSDPQWKGVSSDVFLKHAIDLAQGQGFVVGNVDVTLICQAPKIGPHVAAMKAAVAALLGVDDSQVGIKATTTEGLGFTGRGEGIAALASAVLVGGKA